MEQEQTLFQLKNIGKGTGEVILKGLLACLEKSKEEGESITNLLSKNGEMNWNRFLNSTSEKEIKRFKTSEVNLSNLKEYLKKYGVKFSVKHLEGNEIALAFEAKNRDIIRDAFEKIVSDVVKTPEAEKSNEVISNLVTDPKALPFEERLNKAKEETAQKIMLHEAKEKQERQSQSKTSKIKKPKIKEEVVKE
ncbi:TPA: DUF3801 domain-containing protein [Streptococcus agalactiae]|nr:DUF3801 domain-containing protein [Streptococcus agalactiae]